MSEEKWVLVAKDDDYGFTPTPTAEIEKLHELMTKYPEETETSMSDLKTIPDEELLDRVLDYTLEYGAVQVVAELASRLQTANEKIKELEK